MIGLQLLRAYFTLPPGDGGDGPGGGVGPWSTGKRPTGFRNSPGVAFKPGFLTRSINQSVYVILNATGVPQQAPPINVPAGTLVSIRAHNGANGGNVATVRISHQPELLGSTDGDPITPDSDISWPCDNLGQIWVVGTAGDGIRISIQAGRA
jgi:hypothetical protein